MNVWCILVSVLLIRAVECVSVPSPTISSTVVICDGILIEWIAPELEDCSHVAHYTLQINGPNITYQTTNTSVLVSYDGLQYNEEYNISIYASYCGREGNRTFGTIRTATVPQVMNQTSFVLKIKDRSHATVTFITKVITPGCLVSYPTYVDTKIHQLQELLIESREVNVTEDGTVAFELELPVDKYIVWALFWNNNYFKSNYEIIEFDTNQLQSCTFAVDEDEKISFNCEYANGSTLWGCIVTATNSLTSRPYTNSSIAGSGGGVISVVCDGVYNVTCRGALNSRTGVIGYSGTQYSTVLLVNCTTVITESSAFSSPGIVSVGVIVPSVVFMIPVATGIYCICKIKRRRISNRKETGRISNPKEEMDIDTDTDTGPLLISMWTASDRVSYPREETFTYTNEDTDTDTELIEMKVTEENPLGHTLSVNQPKFVCSNDDEEEYNEVVYPTIKPTIKWKDPCCRPLLGYSTTSEDSEDSRDRLLLEYSTASEDSKASPLIPSNEKSTVSGTISQENLQKVTHVGINTIRAEENDFETTQNQLEEIPFNEKGLFHHSHEYGVTIIIPEGAVQGPATLQFGASLLLTDFKCEGPYEPVSPFVWVHTNPALTKPAELYIPHYAMADSIEDRVKLYLLTRGHEKNAVFKVNNELEATMYRALVRISATHFCTVCLTSTLVPKKRCHLLLATKILEDKTHDVDVCVLYSYKCLQKLKKRYEGCNFVQRPFHFRSGDVRIKVELPENPDWKFKFRECQQELIREDEIDFYQLLGCTSNKLTEEEVEALQFYEEEGSYPPCVKLSFIPKRFLTCSYEAKINLCGDDDDISMLLQLTGDGLDPLPSITSPSSLDSGFSNITLCDPLELSGLKTISDDFVIDVMSFLESRLTTDWMKFGHHLGLDMPYELYHIEESIGHDTKRCIKHIMLLWWKKSPDASHECVAKALKASGYDLLSAMVTLRYGENQSATFCTICQKNHGPEISDSNLLNHVLGDSDILKTEPELADLMSLIGSKIPAKWELFGAQLNIQR